MGDIKVGDQVSNPAGGVSRVIGVYPQGEQEIYRVTFDDGASCEAGAEHLWLVRRASVRRFLKRPVTEVTALWRLATTQQLMAELGRGRHLLIPLSHAVDLTVTARYQAGLWPIDAYALGVFLGDGHITGRSACLTTADPEIVSRLEVQGLSARRQEARNGTTAVAFYYTTGTAFAKLGLAGCRSWEKFVPEAYKRAPTAMRTALLNGLLDTDGYADSRGHASFTTVSEQLAQDVQWLAWSLGYKANITAKQPTYRYKGVACAGRRAYTVWIKGGDRSALFALKRKQERVAQAGERVKRVAELGRRIVSIARTRRAEAQCIRVDHPNGLYLTDDFIVTHNTAALVNEAIALSLRYAGNQILIVRNTASALENNTLKELFKFMPPAQIGINGRSRALWDYSPGHRRVRFLINGSRILWSGTEDWVRLMGPEYGAVILDEAHEISAEAGQTLASRLSLTDSTRLLNIREVGLTPEAAGFVPGELVDPKTGLAHIPMYFCAGFNPQPGGWLEEWFLKDAEIRHHNDIIYYAKPAEDRVFIQARPEDNVHLPPNYRQQLASFLTPEMQRRYLNGEWISLEGTAFVELDTSVHVIDPFPIPKEWPRLRAIDHGASKSSGTACLWGAYYAPFLFVYDEYLEFEQPAVDHIKAIQMRHPGEEYFLTVIDPSTDRKSAGDLSIFQQYRQGSIPVTKANNDVEASMNICRAMLKVDPSRQHPLKKTLGSPLVFITRNCKNTISQLSTAAFRRRKDGVMTPELRAENSDATDAFRYLCCAVGMRHSKPVIRMSFG